MGIFTSKDPGSESGISKDLGSDLGSDSRIFCPPVLTLRFDMNDTW